MIYLFYIYPSEEGLPIRALIREVFTGMEIVAVWNDRWEIEGEEVEDDMSAALTAHAASLGLECA